MGIFNSSFGIYDNNEDVQDALKNLGFKEINNPMYKYCKTTESENTCYANIVTTNIPQPIEDLTRMLSTSKI